MSDVVAETATSPDSGGGRRCRIAPFVALAVAAVIGALFWVLAGAKERGCFVEVNAHPSRLDLDDVHCRMAKDLGLKVAISTDAHSTRGLGNIVLSVGTARRAWARAADIVNTRPLNEILADPNSRRPATVVCYDQRGSTRAKLT